MLPKEGRWFVGWSQPTAAAESQPTTEGLTAGGGLSWGLGAVDGWVDTTNQSPAYQLGTVSAGDEPPTG